VTAAHLRGPARLTRALRAAAFGLAWLLASIACFCWSAHARTGELLEDAGAGMLSYARAGHLDASRTLHVNGLVLRVLSGSTRDSLTAVLDFFHERCRRVGGELARLAPSAPGRSVHPLPARVFEPVLRREGTQTGYLGCLDLGAAPLGLEPLLRRLRAFARDGDLAVLGGLRFVWAAREHEHTTYVAVWNAGSLRLADLAPARGDAPGADVDGIPRPPGSRRVMSVFQEGAAPMLVGYRAQLPASALGARYRKALIDGGFVVREGARAPGAPAFLVASRGAASTLVMFTAESVGTSSALLVPLPETQAPPDRSVRHATP